MQISEMIKKHDPANQFQVLKDSYTQVEYAWNLNIDLSLIDTSKVKNIILTGLGGSAIGGELIQNFFRTELKYPYSVNRNYELPPYANQDTLVLASSYSGNTEETLSALNEAIAKKCQVVCVTTGGKMEEIAKANNIPLGKLLKGYQPRFALWINFFTLLKTLHSLKLVPDQNKNVADVIDLLKRKGEEYSKEKNATLDFAENMVGYIPVIYAVSDYTSVIGTRFKGQFNENSKQHAYFAYFPELDHNEIMGWEGYKPDQINIKLVNILDEEYHPQVKKRIEVTSEVIKKNGGEVVDLKSNEKNAKLKLVDLIYFADWATYYFAVIRNFDPTTIENINYLKSRL